MAQIEYFLGANSASGFYSLYDHLIDRETAQGLYILKGGAGCGKSSFMRRVARHAQAAGYQAEYILCSGDPDSLDAVVLPELKTALVDGTAPHIIEPKYPGVVERYVNLGKYYDSAGLQEVRAAVIEQTKEYQKHYKRCYRCLSAAAELDSDNRELLAHEAKARLLKRAKGIIARELKGNGSGGEVTLRFLSAVSCAGRMSLWDTVEAQCRRVCVLEDSFGLSHVILEPILAAATARDFHVIACPDPLTPDRLLHLLIPELDLAFVTSTPEQPYTGRAYRRLRLDAMAKETYRKFRSRVRFARKVSNALQGEAMAALGEAKARHDSLEALYNPYVDFDGVYALADQVAEQIIPGGATASPQARPEDSEA